MNRESHMSHLSPIGILRHIEPLTADGPHIITISPNFTRLTSRLSKNNDEDAPMIIARKNLESRYHPTDG
jgi:hypothetical protein